MNLAPILAPVGGLRKLLAAVVLGLVIGVALIAISTTVMPELMDPAARRMFEMAEDLYQGR